MRCAVFKLLRKLCVHMYVCCSKGLGYSFTNALIDGWVVPTYNEKFQQAHKIKTFIFFIMTRPVYLILNTSTERNNTPN